MINLILTLLFSLSVSVCGVKKYCGEDYCNNSKQHTLCKYQSAQPASNCINYVNIVTEGDKSAIVQKINSRRNKVAGGELSSLPSAENMLKMGWNEELAVSAQRWADQCVQHSVPDIRDTCRDLGNMPVGQNIATVYGEAPGLTAMALVDVWYTELLNLNASIIAQYRPPIEVRSTHYEYFTQLVWANSYEVGCGGVRFTQASGVQKNQTVQRLVCNFGPAGNRVGESVYASGAPCSRCPDDGNCDDDHLALCRTDFPSATISVSSITQNQSQNTNELVFRQTSASIPVQIEITSSATDESASISDDLFPLFDFSSNYYKFANQEITIAPAKPAPCKEVMAIDELLELLKQKLSSDPLMKDLHLTKKNSDQTDNSFTDAGVAAFVSRLYSKNKITTPTKPTEKEYVNSTLLADLVDAVIFRGGERYSATERLEPTPSYSLAVSPIRIQAELAEVKVNSEFTGHYFFPKDDEPTSTIGESSDAEYYTVTEMPVSAVISELEDIKRNTEFKDFVEEILESETVTEMAVSAKLLLPDNSGSLNIGHNNKKFLELPERNDQMYPEKDVSFSPDDASDDTKKFHIRNKRLKKLVCRSKNCDESIFMRYTDLLKRMASEIRLLDLKRFQCSCSCTTRFFCPSNHHVFGPYFCI